MKGGATIVSISVLFPVHKSHEYLEEALQSICRQSFQDWDLLFLDNSDQGIAEKVWNLDQRIRYVRLNSEFGLAESLNAGISLSNSKYLARMDFDDISLPDRLKTQFAFLEANPQIDVLGTCIRFIGNQINPKEQLNIEICRPVKHSELESFLLLKNPFFHPTVMFRRESIIKHQLFYDSRFNSAEDLELWTRCAKKVKFGNINEVHLLYRTHQNQYSRLDGERSRYLAHKILLKYSVLQFTNSDIAKAPILKAVKHHIFGVLRNIRGSRARKFEKFN